MTVHDKQSNHQATTIHDLLAEAFDRFNARFEYREGVGMSTGCQDLDNLTGGLHHSQLTILADGPTWARRPWR